MVQQHVLIATVNFGDATKVHGQVQAIFAGRPLKEDVDYVIVECPTRERMREYLDAIDRSHDHVLVIAQPSLTDQDDVRTILASILEEHPGSVILLSLNNAGLGGLRINPGQVIHRLDERSLRRLGNLVSQYLKAQELEDYNRFAGDLNKYKQRWLSPLARPSGAAGENVDMADDISDKDFGPSPQNTQDGAAPPSIPDMIEAKWNNLAERMKEQARVSLDTAIRKSGSTSTRDTDLLGLSSAFLHLWVETRLYALRAKSNFQVYHNAHKQLTTSKITATLERIPPGYGINPNERAEVKKAVAGIIKDYFSALRQYDRALRKNSHGRSYFTRRFGDAEQFRSWSEVFGPKRVNPEHEPGWDIHAASASELLFYHYRDALGHEYTLDGTQRTSAFLFWIYKNVTGFGLRPTRSAVITIIILAGFAVLHALDDRLTGCAGPPALTGSVGAMFRYIEYYLAVSVSSLTSLGAVATPCGSFHGLLMAVESIFGYFLLAVLTTLFVQALLDR